MYRAANKVLTKVKPYFVCLLSLWSGIDNFPIYTDKGCLIAHPIQMPDPPTATRSGDYLSIPPILSYPPYGRCYFILVNKTRSYITSFT